MRYRLNVEDGALTLASDAGATTGDAQIELADSVTAKPSALTIVGGSLTLSAQGTHP
jgi:hypothetical protein